MWLKDQVRDFVNIFRILVQTNFIIVKESYVSITFLTISGPLSGENLVKFHSDFRRHGKKNISRMDAELFLFFFKNTV